MNDERRFEPEEYPAAKRPKFSRQENPPTPQHDYYTIAWICALHIEMAAAQAMLDEVHKVPFRNADDTNSYVLGSIKGHNIVIAGLPESQYGTNNAATVATNLKRSFSGIRMALMVGIGGGVPTKEDIRLGDVVVGTRIMQYDLGKIVADGKFERSAVPRIQHQFLGTALTSLRAKHELGPSRVPSILQQKLEAHVNYSRPSGPDRLFQSTYEHDSQTSSCDTCDESKLIPRSRRPPDTIKIHHGGIASGNQVMKHGATRDNVARELDVICFEMEAAGLMDIIPCLPIRGICDYSDSHKNKEWQRYAAATAAAYARELIEELPVSERHTVVTSVPNSDQDTNENHRQRLMKSLEFKQMESRRMTIENNHTKTCQWLLNHRDYKTWLDPARLAQHRGFLWISGKPGAGKSTIMKFAYSNMRRKSRLNAKTASFFFNARGESLEKSSLGMYRSLLLQLLREYPDLQTVLDDPDILRYSEEGCPPLNILKDLFNNAISGLGQRRFTCFIDALDECDEQQVMDMVEFFEDLGERAESHGIPFRICFSSRHYPYIVLKQGIRLTLEDESGHSQDLTTYITSRLRIKERALLEELQSELLRKAAGVFMWVVLVVQILNDEYQNGGLALRKRLAEIPSDLSTLFKSILTRDNENMDSLLLCIRWVLFAERPLQPEEYRHALWCGLSLKNMVDSEIPAPIDAGDKESLDRIVVSSSKGLAEITKSKSPTVQFIHESVRDFLTKDNGLRELWPELEIEWQSSSHEELKESCRFYLSQPMVSSSVEHTSSILPKPEMQEQVLQKYPFFKYATQNILYHANAAAEVFSQNEFLSRFPIPSWIRMNNLFEKHKVREYTSAASLFYILVDKGLSRLVRARPREESQIRSHGERYHYPLFAALANGDKDTVAALLTSPSCNEKGVDIMEGLRYRSDLKDYKDRTPLSWAAQHGRLGILKLLLQTGAAIDEVDGNGCTALLRASENGQEAAAELLIKGEADINFEDDRGWTALLLALQNGHDNVAMLLIDHGADINTKNDFGMTPLLLAIEKDHDNESIIRLLVDKGANINTKNDFGMTPLLLAIEKDHDNESIIRLLVDKGADINAKSDFGMTPLLLALVRYHDNELIIRLLVDKGADINAKSDFGMTPLLLAIEKDHDNESIIRLLVDKGADINTKSDFGMTPLLLALVRYHNNESIIRLLVDKGADINAKSDFGMTHFYWP